MEDKVLPVIFLNLCGEMLYVINQRLEAQKISPEKTSKVNFEDIVKLLVQCTVIQDILSTMLNDQFVEELFKPQKMYTRLAMQSVFEKLVHSSIMRLNSNSMSKLYDLMLMVFKYQVVNCQKPQDIILVTLNHLDAIKDSAQPYSDLTSSVKNLYSLLSSNYSDLSHSEYECLHRCINAFLQDLNVRDVCKKEEILLEVSVLMKLGLQLPSGEIVIKKDHISESNAAKDDSQETIPFSCFDFEGERNFTLGSNIYAYTMTSGVESAKASEEPQSSLPTVKNINHTDKESEEIEGKPEGIEEFSLLTRLIGKCMPSDNVPEIILASPNEENYDLHGMTTEDSGSIVNIDASQNSKEDLEKICNELVVNTQEQQKFDILELLDTVE